MRDTIAGPPSIDHRHVVCLRCAIDSTRRVMRVFGIAGWSGSGKTTLIERLLPALTSRAVAVSVVKHAHERFDIDRPGKDSYRIRAAGAVETMVASPKRWALIHELRDEAEWPLSSLLARIGPCDLVLVEGFKRDALPKLEVHRPSVGKPLLALDDADIVAIATDDRTAVSALASTPTVSLDDIEAIASLVLAHARPMRIGGVDRFAENAAPSASSSLDRTR